MRDQATLLCRHRCPAFVPNIRVCRDQGPDLPMSD